MKLLQKNYSKIGKHIRNINAHNKQKGKHGKAFENFLAEQFNFPMHQQHNEEVDFPVDVVAQSDAPEELVGDWEVKYYSSKNICSLQLGDVKRKLKSFAKGLIIVLGIYDGDPSNLVDVQFFKIKRNKEIQKMKTIWSKASDYVKDRANSIEKTRELCRSINSMHKGAFYLNNLCRQERWSNSKQKWENEARQIALNVKLSELQQIA